MNKIGLFFIFIALLLVGSKIGNGNRYYVSPTGLDTNQGTIDAPWLTIEHGVQQLKAGDTLYIRGGIYHETVWTNTPGTKTAPISILGYPNETAIIDGEYTLPRSQYTLVAIENDYYKISNLEIRNSAADGLLLIGKNITVSNIYCHDNTGNGIGARGNYGLVENSFIYRNGLRNSDGSATDYPEGLYAYADNIILRNNEVWLNYGEGINVHHANYITVEDNISYDNWSANLYVSDATNVLAQRNFIYASGAMNVVPNNTQVGILIGDEKHNPTSKNNAVINNIVYGTRINLYAGADGYTYDNLLIANNTFVNSVYISGVRFNSSGGMFINSGFKNNIIVQEDTLPVISFNVKPTGLTFAYNLWSKTSDVWGNGIGDIIGDPMLAKTDVYTNPLWYKILSNSPAINNGSVLSKVKDDYWKNIRGAHPDIGAHEYKK